MVACNILKLYREQFPKYLQYDSSHKAYIATDDFNHDFIHNSMLNSFSHYLTAIGFIGNGSTNLVSSVFLEVEAPLRNINPLQIRPILKTIREKLQIDIGYISLSSPN